MDIAKLKVAKYKCLQSTLFFTRYFFKHTQQRKFVVGEHHEIIAKTLDKVIKGELTKVIFNIAPRYGKTELSVKNFIAKGLAHNPKSKYIHLSYSDDLALDNSESVKDIVKSEAYQQMFPIKIKANSDSKKKWYTEQGGGVYATSASGQVTGFGAGQVDDLEKELNEIESSNLFGGALIIDDPIKPDDADSDNVRERINQKFDSTIRNRVNSRKTPIIIIMQRLHERDLCGYLMEQEPGEWTVVSLPCIKEDGSPLWEFKHTLEELEKLKKTNEIVFERQYMQDPKPLKGILFPEKELNFYKPDPLLKFETSLSYCDVADEGDDNLCAPIGRNIKEKIYITDVLFSKENSEITLPLLTSKLKKNDVKYIRVESNAMGAMYGRNLQKLINPIQVYPATSTTNKHTRILMDAAFIKQYCYFLRPEYQSDEYKKFMKELCGYLKAGGSKHDDAPDALTGLVAFIRGVLSHLYV